ncbi:MAG: 5'/3'-nucleotidase SurE [Elusimicrobia bacterium]|nr:5'/3'-nucleotidase SurE [Elusimicrobiota bacterium]MBU2614461.1 5'/3'-nucleotidase SurE [Elusimicrobiota bacterium]
MKRILVSNDDGIFGIGLSPLVKEISKLGKVFVVVPEKEQSAVSHSMTLRGPVRARQISGNTYVMDGTPADCVRFGIIQVGSRNIDLVVSGINFGSNLGVDIFYSGTVGAAREGTFMGIPSIAVSLVSRTGKNFQTAAKFAAKLSKNVLNGEFEKNILLNINVPDVSAGRIKGIEITTLGKKIYDDTIETRKDPYGLNYYWLKGKVVANENKPGTDIYAVEKNKISVTPLTLNGTDFEAVEKLKEIKI